MNVLIQPDAIARAPLGSANKIRYISLMNFLYIFIVSLLSVLILNLQYFNIWFITPIIHIDPWHYWGTAEAFEYIKNNFGQTYYFRRWTLVFPNIIFQKIFSPYYAQIAIRSILAFSIIFISNIIIYRKLKSYTYVIIFTTLIISNEYIIRSIGNSYNMGTGCLIILIIILLSDLSYKNRKFIFINSIIVGFLFSILIITYQWLVYFTPMLFINYYLNLYKKLNIIKISYLSSIMLIGFIGGIIIDYLIGYFIGVDWVNLINYSFDFHRSIAKSGDYSVPLAKFFREQAFAYSSFFIPCILLILLIFTIGNSKRNAILLISVMFVYILGVLAGGNPLMVCQTNFYLSFLLIFIFINLIPSLVQSETSLKKLLIIIIFFILYFYSNHIFYTRTTKYDEIIVFYFKIIPFIFILILIFKKIIEIKLQKKCCNCFSYILMALCLISMAPPTQIWAQALRHPMLSDGINQREMNSIDAKKMMFELSAEVRSAANVYPNNRIWILDIRQRDGNGWSPVISSFYGLYSALAVGSNPNPINCSHLAWIMAYPNSIILVYGSDSFHEAMTLVGGLINHCGSYNYSEVDSRSLNAISIKISKNETLPISSGGIKK